MPTKSFLKPSVLNQAVAVAMASDSPKKMGAILIKKRRVITTATNSYERTHPVQYWAALNASKVWGKSYAAKVYLHAEINALVKAREDADTIIICRVGGHGQKELRESFPCPICYAYIQKNSAIKHIHYSTNHGFMYEYIGD